MDIESREAVWAIIEKGKVTATVVWDGVTYWPPAETSEMVNLADHPHVGIGWDYVDGEFVDNRPAEKPDA